ncbi:sigma-54 dependent transcriptional regulator [Siphonobacter sp. SORGH_AS_1065]|uniref:sigma-54-dependent transcriptional regulator n=1 Tax=Siphonobacter sp. SORGH_AS_1065 TaxID=3041795 RepID=UPI00278949CE|nr:sigma-54 dependent transcriptional regulator [Siphonobacter sp. SORGH_AS_1065]MDQ1090035.1 two-component system NtrC family response regulator [Siphonobacter sp. SORGH_AS_1065]
MALRAAIATIFMQTKILLVDDETRLRNLLARLLRLEEYEVLEAENIQSGLTLLQLHPTIKVVLLDVRLPDGNGLETVPKVKQINPSAEILLLTAYGTIPDSVQAIKNGAFDYLVKGDDNDKIITLVSKAVEKANLQFRIRELENQVSEKLISLEDIQGESPAILKAKELARKVSHTDTTVLLIGETGTGKELFAQAIHRESNRRTKTFLAINCGAFSRELLESELFGHRAGAFTGATKDKKGLFEEANGGTLFLDEMGEMSLDLQAKLLRVLENREFFRVGDTKPTQVNVRIIAATNRDLLKESQEGHFRADLYYRLSVFQMDLPPLRERLSDLPILAQGLAQSLSRRLRIPFQTIEPDFLKQLSQHNWPGNIRELRNVIERALILSDTGLLKAETLPFHTQNQSIDSFELSVIEQQHIRKVLQHTKGNKTEAARLLGIGLTTLYRKIEEYQLNE